MLPLSLLRTSAGHPMVRTRHPHRVAIPRTSSNSHATPLCRVQPAPPDTHAALHAQTQLVELKNGETYNGHLQSCDNWMNISLKEVICTSRDGDRFWRLPEVIIRGEHTWHAHVRSCLSSRTHAPN